MGMWDIEPWDNDTAADWFGELFDKTTLRNAWLTGIQADPSYDPETVRAAAWLFTELGRVYVWPITQLDADLDRTIVALEHVLESEIIMDNVELFAKVQGTGRTAIAAE